MVQEQQRRGRCAAERGGHRRHLAGKDRREIGLLHLSARLFGETREHGRVRNGTERTHRDAHAAHDARRPGLRGLPDDRRRLGRAAVARFEREAFHLHVVARREHDLHHFTGGDSFRLTRRAYAVARRHERSERLCGRTIAARRSHGIDMECHGGGGHRRPAREECK